MDEIPVFNLPTIERLRDRLNERVMVGHFRETLDLDGINELVSELRRELPSGVSRDAVFESVRYLIGTELQPKVLSQVSWRLAGNVERLRAGQPVLPWSTQLEDEWVPLQILQAVPYRTRRDKIGYIYSFRALAGTPCPLRLSTFWKREALRVIAQHLGFSGFRGSYPFHEGMELVGLRLLGKVEPRLSRDGPGFYEIECPPAMVEWNRQTVLRMRVRLDPCPNRWTHPCRRCVVGYEACPAAVHAKSFTTGQCQTCGEPEAVFDPERNPHKCVNCDTKERLRKRS